MLIVVYLVGNIIRTHLVFPHFERSIAFLFPRSAPQSHISLALASSICDMAVLYSNAQVLVSFTFIVIIKSNQQRCLSSPF